MSNEEDEYSLFDIVARLGCLLTQALPDSLDYVLILRDRGDHSSGYAASTGSAPEVLALLQDYVAKLEAAADGGVTKMEVRNGKFRVVGSKSE